jgi:hypothetical protein
MAGVGAVETCSISAPLLLQCRPLDQPDWSRSMIRLSQKVSNYSCYRPHRNARPDRRGNGSTDRRAGGPADHLRHVQGGGPGDGDGECEAAGKAWRQVGRLGGGRRVTTRLRSRALHSRSPTPLMPHRNIAYDINVVTAFDHRYRRAYIGTNVFTPGKTAT